MMNLKISLLSLLLLLSPSFGGATSPTPSSAPSTSGTAECKDGTDMFQRKETGNMKDCSWLIKRNTNGRCKLDVFHDGEYKPIRGLCPKTCGVCGDGGSNENIQEELVALQESNRKQDEKIKQLEELVTYHEEAIKELQGPPTMAPTTFGYGCYTSESCFCDDKTCNAEGCVGEGFVWISPQTSPRGCGLDTRCTEEQLANCKATGASTVSPTNPSDAPASAVVYVCSADCGTVPQKVTDPTFTEGLGEAGEVIIDGGDACQGPCFVPSVSNDELVLVEGQLSIINLMSKSMTQEEIVQYAQDNIDGNVSEDRPPATSVP